MNIRPARRQDEAAIVAFTTGTFEWGDFIPESLPQWLATEDDSIVLVATDDDDRPIGMVRVIMMSADEAWLHAARVHPEERRKGIAMEATTAALEWAKTQGASVARLLTESWNTAAHAQVHKAGFRDVSTWFYAIRPIGSTQPDPAGNGGRRVPGQERLTPAPSFEAEPAFMSWSSGDLIRHARNVYPIGWTFRGLRIADLEEAAKQRELWSCRAGWVMGAFRDEAFHVPWMTTTPDDAYPLVQAALDRATDLGAEKLTALVPDVDYIQRAFQRIGAELHHDILWEYGL